MSTLSLNHVYKKFGPLEVLQDISLEFAPGTVTAIVGDNGAGKSTLLKLLAGIYSPDSGEIFLGNEKLNNRSPHQRREAGIEMVYQDLALAPHHDVTTNLFLGRELTGTGFLKKKEMITRAQHVLSEIEIQLPSLSYSVGTLSGGQQQAVALARALLFNPSVILLDEPTAALAAREVDRVLHIIQKQKKNNRTIILVSHRLNDVLSVADRIVVLKHGSVFSDAPATTLSMTDLLRQIVS